MTIVELNELIDKKISTHDKGVEKRIEALERKVETLLTEINILKQGSNL